MIDKMIEGLSGAALIEVLESNADSVTNGKYTRRMEQSEVDEARMRHADLAAELEDKQAQFKEQKSIMNAELKRRTAEMKNLLQQIRLKTVDEEGKIYTLKNYNEKMVYMYSAGGLLIDQRRMTPEERQMSINNVISMTGTDGD